MVNETIMMMMMTMTTMRRIRAYDELASKLLEQEKS